MNWHKLSALVIAVLISTQTLWSQSLRNLQLQSETFGSAGTEFWFAIPPNELAPFPVDDLSIFVSSMYNTTITVSRPDKTSYTRDITAGVTRILNDARQETSWNWEVRESEKVRDLGIRITSLHPVVVYVLNSKVTTADGFLVLPKHQLGTEYFVTSYWDFQEIRNWAGGFIVVASEDNTTVNIDLRGVGGNVARTAGGRLIGTGQPFSVTLNAGQVYMVKGDATTRASFDLSGTRVTSDKPVGLIPFHERTTMPNMLINGNGRNTLNDMALPVPMCGKQYITSNVNRNPISAAGRGDVYRIFATQDNTQWSVRCYNKETRQLFTSQGGVLAKAGDFADITQTHFPIDLLDGYSVWSASNPVYVTQYSPSSSFDNDPEFDPFMWNNVAHELWPNSVFFQVAPDSKFEKHQVTIFVDIAPGLDTTVLDSVRCNGVKLVNHPNTLSGRELKSNRIPDTRVFVTTLLLTGKTDSMYYVTGTRNTRFAVTVAGVGNTDAYGWSTGARHPNIVALDSVPPVISETSTTATSVSLSITERRNQPSPVRPIPLPSDQVESGICTVWLDSASNMNLTTWIRPTSGKLDSTTAVVEQIDLLKAASGKLAAMDFAGNISYRTVSIAQKDRPTIVTSDVGNVRVGTTARNYIAISNGSPAPLTITSVSITGTSADSVSWSIVTPTSFVIPASTTDSIALDFTPTLPYVSIASCTVVTNVGPLTGTLSARAVAPRIAVTARSIIAPSMDDYCDTVLRIQNIGDDTLTVTQIESSSLLIRVTPVTQPVRLAPNADTTIRFCYMPVKEGVDTAIITTYSDAFQRTLDSTLLLGMYGTTSVWYGAQGASDVSPHPVQDELKLTVPESVAGNGTYEIVDLAGSVVQRGQTVLEQGLGMTIPARGLTAGSYSLRVTVGTQTVSTMFVKVP